MKFEKGNLFECTTGPIFVTASAFISNDGSLLMNRGAAATCSQKYPDIGKVFGDLARKGGTLHRNEVGNKFLRFGTIYDSKNKLGIFQVKYHFKDDVDLSIVRYSATMLAGISRVIGTVNMNFPGCGYGQIDRRQVMHVLDDVLDKEDVIVWRLDASEYENSIQRPAKFEVDEKRAVEVAEELADGLA